MKVRMTYSGSHDKTKSHLKHALQAVRTNVIGLDYYGKKGVEALKEFTPKRTGKTSESWVYRIEDTKDGKKLIWTNTNRNNGVLIAMIIQYGHGTRRGAFVQGIDYINPALRPIFEKLTDEVTEELKKS